MKKTNWEFFGILLILQNHVITQVLRIVSTYSNNLHQLTMRYYLSPLWSGNGNK